MEADETYVGGKEKGSNKRGGASDKKVSVLSLVERGGEVRSFPLSRVTAELLHTVIKYHVRPDARFMSDQFTSYQGLAKHFTSHETVNHSKKEYARGDVTTNTVEGYFALVKRGIYGTFHHVSRKHLFRYLDEFDFRYGLRGVKDGERTEQTVKSLGGRRLTFKRLTYKGDKNQGLVI